jgi:hypothetical protein
MRPTHLKFFLTSLILLRKPSLARHFVKARRLIDNDALLLINGKGVRLIGLYSPDVKDPANLLSASA